MHNHLAMRWPFTKKATSHKDEARRHYNAKDYVRAEPHLNAMLAVNLTDEWALDVLSRLYMNTGRHNEAVELLQRLLTIDAHPEILRRIIHAGCVSQQIEDVFQYAPNVNWGPEDEELLSKIYDSFWPNDPCKDFFVNTDWSSDLPFPIFVRAEGLYDSGAIKQAIDLLNSLISREIVNESTLMLASRICKALGQVEMAHDLWVNYLRHIEGELSRKRSLAKRLRYAKRFGESLEVAMMVLEETPQDEAMLTLLTEISHRTQMPEMAIQAFHQLDSSGRAKLFHVRRYALAAISSQSPDEILDAIKRLISLGADANATIRNAYSKLCELGASSHAKQLLELVQSTPLEIDLKATRALHQGDIPAAISILDEGLKLHPDYVSFLMRKGIALEALGRIDDAIQYFEMILEVNPEHTSASIRRLKCGMKIWPEDHYFDEITRACAATPENLTHQFARLNYVLSVMKEYDLAMEIISICLQHHPRNQRARMYHALILSWRGEHQQARSSIDKSLLRWPSSNDVFITASQIEKNAGDSKRQLQHINSMLALHDLAPVNSSSEELAITPGFLSTETSKIIEDNRLVSIIMTTYKRDPLLNAAIDSILNQTYRNLELIIVDDCSPDDNFSYLEQLARDDQRIRVFQMEENGGTYVAKNFGMTQAKGDFIGFMDSDDYCHAQRIEYQIASFDIHPEAMGITHDYFRIDEFSDIEFRGIGALRMACISLLIRREVVEEIGFFDSLRVGADTEYIERIEAKYGQDRRLRLRIPSMFMMLHSKSLTGGGPFHISWRSVTGHRLQHHSSFRAWHKKIRSGNTEGYLPRRIFTRPFEAPDEMKSTHFGWEEGMPLFSEMIKKRNHDWWKGKKSVWQKKLSPKLAGRNFVEELGLKVPDLYWKGKNIEQIPEFDQLPEDFVIKPEKGWSSNNVYCMKNGEDLLSHQPHNRQTIIDGLLNNEFVATNKPTIMIEELLKPEQKQSDDGIPRDFKFYCFGEDIVMIHVALRKSEIHKTKNEHQYYTPEFKIIESRVMENRQQGQIPIDRPDCWDEMVQSAQTIGKALGIYMRIDMFPTNRGAVFGEFTPTPHGGNGYSNFADEYLGSFWKGEEGVE